MDLQVIRNTIADLENADNTFDNCAKLASLYIILNQAQTNISADATADELKDILPAYGQYIQAKREYQLNGGSEERTVKMLSFVCQEIYEFIQALYSSTDMPEERKSIRNLISKLSEIA